MILEKQQMRNALKDRFEWAASVLDCNGMEQILEIGCGTGKLVERIAAMLPGGRILAIDKSAAMIHAAQQRNQFFIESGVVQCLIQDFTIEDRCGPFKPVF